VACVNGACAAGQACNKADNNCYWAPLKSAAGQPLDGYTLRLTTSGTGAVAKVEIPVTTTGASDTVWSGGIWAGTNVLGSGAARTPVYSYQYDDATSTFTCSTLANGTGGTNDTDYTITFCPGGKTATVAATTASA
jgi:hypothetical protein